MAVLHTPARTSQVNAQTTGLRCPYGPRVAFSASHVSQIGKPRFWLRVNYKSRHTNHAPVMPMVPARVAPWLRPLPAPNFDTYSSAVTCATHAPLDQSATLSCPRSTTGSTGVVCILHKELCDLRSTHRQTENTDSVSLHEYTTPCQDGQVGITGRRSLGQSVACHHLISARIAGPVRTMGDRLLQRTLPVRGGPSPRDG
jgi:hypothetical protein